MKEKIEKIIKYLNKYLPDILFLIGVWVASYNLLRPSQKVGLLPSLPSLTHTEYFTEYKVLGIMLIALALDIAIRRYSAKRNK
ncbi:MAG: hypothetical protein NT012_00290 [Candidatus Nealsonbacteria bacterium]|nr:hypothetical protein [Candidatus Nealsonbacteria bacterium]